MDRLPEFCVAVVVCILLPNHAIDDVERSSDWRKDRIQDRDVTARSVAPISARKISRKLIDKSARSRILSSFTVSSNNLKEQNKNFDEVVINRDYNIKIINECSLTKFRRPSGTGTANQSVAIVVGTSTIHSDCIS